MPPDTSETVEIGQSPAKMVGYLVLGLIMTSLAGACLLIIRERTHSLLVQGFGYTLVGASLLFFATCTLAILWMAVRGCGKPVIVLSQMGIQDVRVAKEIIPWGAIDTVSTWQMGHQRVMVLSVDPVLESQLTLTAVARRSRSPNRMLGADGLCVSANGLTISHDRLLAAVTIYREAHS